MIVSRTLNYCWWRPRPAGLLQQPLPTQLSRGPPPAKFIHTRRCHQQGGGPQGDTDALEFLLETPGPDSSKERLAPLQCLRPLIINVWNNTIKVEADGLEIITAILLRSISLFAPRFFFFSLLTPRAATASFKFCTHRHPPPPPLQPPQPASLRLTGLPTQADYINEQRYWSLMM